MKENITYKDFELEDRITLSEGELEFMFSSQKHYQENIRQLESYEEELDSHVDFEEREVVYECLVSGALGFGFISRAKEYCKRADDEGIGENIWMVYANFFSNYARDDKRYYMDEDTFRESLIGYLNVKRNNKDFGSYMLADFYRSTGNISMAVDETLKLRKNTTDPIYQKISHDLLVELL